MVIPRGNRRAILKMPKHHYLAQCYLKGFAARHYDNAIWQYRKSTRALQLKGIGNVANRPNYYSHEFVAGEFDDHPEQFFSKIESRWPSLRQRLESQKSGILNTIVSPSMASRHKTNHGQAQSGNTTVYADTYAESSRQNGMDEDICIYSSPAQRNAYFT